MNEAKVYPGRKGTKKLYAMRRRSNASLRRPLNRFEAESDLKGVNASAKKLKVCDEDFDVNCEFGYRIINFFAVFSVISQHVKCKTCDSDIAFYERSPRGLGFKIVVACPKCPEVAIPSCKFIRNAYEINRRIVLAMRLLGIGLHGIIKFCAFMELPRPIFQSFYDNLVDMIAVATATVRDASMKNAAQEEKKKSEENGQFEGITVFGDDSWRKNEFSSLFGITSLIGWLTGKIVDVEVKSKYCKSCEHWKSKLGTIKYDEWYITHADECQTNHEGSSGKMEVDTVVEMFVRSESLHSLKYASYIGDSKTFKGIKDKNPYENFEVRKKGCIDHIQKRNESFNATVWKLAPKSYSSGKKVLNIATDIAVCNFNDGLTNILRIIKVLEMDIGVQSYNFCLEADAKRIKHAELSLTDEEKEARSSMKSLRKENEEEYLNLEGQLYGPGIAD